MKQDKADKIIKKAERKAEKAAKQVQNASKKAEVTRQKQEAQTQKKAAKAAAAATKKAEKKTKKAELAAKKAAAAAKKAEDKKAKALAKVAAKTAGKTAGKGGEGEGGAAPKKKKGKKKLLLLAIPVLIAAIGAGVFFFFFKGGGEEEAEAVQEPVTPPAEYVLEENHVSALPVWGDVVVYLDEVQPEAPAESEEGEAAEGETEDAEAEAEPAEEGGFQPFIYRYENLQNASGLVSAYTALMTAEDAGFSVVDETLMRIDPPEEFGVSGAVQLARNVPAAEDGTGGGVQSLLLKWVGNTCTVTVEMPEGTVHDPKPAASSPASPRRGLSDIEAMHPSQLGLPGESMDEYELMPQEGSVLIAGNPSPCMRINIYDQNSQIAGSFFLSGDGHLYKLDEAANAVVELDWE